MRRPRPRAPPSRPGPTRRRKCAPTCSTRSDRRSWRAPRSSASCCRARKARPCPKAPARSCAPRASSNISPAKRCAATARRSNRRAPASTSQTYREAVGVFGLITPWNFPIAIPAWKAAPALAFGNTVVLKPANPTPAIAHALAAIIHEAGAPAGRVQPGARRRRRRRRHRRPSRRRRHLLHRLAERRRPGRRRRRSRGRRACRWKWAARTRWWCWTTPNSTAPSNRDRRRLLRHRPALHRLAPRHRHRRHPRPLRRRRWPSAPRR